MSLYSGEEATVVAPKPDKISSFVEPVIFKDDLTDVWGIETTSCKTAEISENVTSEGRRAIKISWDRNLPDCIWAGFGIGWDGYAGKDISELIPYAAIQLHVRAAHERMFGLPMVLTLEDYSGGMGFAYTDNKYFERTFIDTVWQTVTVPLKAFDMKIENLDPTNIKQIMFELQQGGAIYVDDINLVFYEEQVVAPWYVEESLTDPTALPIQLFDDAFINNNGWGIMKDECRDIRITDELGGKAIQASWTAQDGCGDIRIGISWNKWFPVNATSLADKAMVSLSLKLVDAASTGEIQVQLEDYDGQISEPYSILLNTFPKGEAPITIPFKELILGINVENTKQLIFTFTGSGEVVLDNIQLAEMPRS